MDTLQILVKKMQVHGIKEGRDSSRAFAELSAYAQELDLLYASAEEVQRECTLCTASSFGLDAAEKLYEICNSSLKAEKRREILVQHLRSSPNSINKNGVINFLQTLGVTAEIREVPAEDRLVIKCLKKAKTSKGKNELIKEVSAFLPAHLEAEFEGIAN